MLHSNLDLPSLQPLHFHIPFFVPLLNNSDLFIINKLFVQCFHSVMILCYFESILNGFKRKLVIKLFSERDTGKDPS